MRLAIISFVIGVVGLQQQARLLDYLPLFALMLCSALLLALMRFLQRFLQRFLKQQSAQETASSFISLLRSFFTGLSFTGLGFVWASLFAHWYLAQELPSAWEGRDVTVIGTIDSLPFRFERGVRFNFLVEQVLPEGADTAPLPPKLALSWYAPLRGNHDVDRHDDLNDQVADVQPGERWRLTVRLKRPHGNMNPEGFDYEVWLLEQGLRATGTVRPVSEIRSPSADSSALSNQRLDGFVWRVGNLVERARGLLRDRIHAALPQAPYAGVIVALVMGDQREVGQSDWKIFNRTGVGHLFSISGLHITMVAGLFASLLYWLWRHSFFLVDYLNVPLPLRLPAQKAAAIAGALMALLYVALTGFGVPAQRTLYMLSVVAFALWSGRLTSISHVLCVALGLVVVLDPWAVLWPGFWLSFGAVAMILFASVGRAQPAKPDNRRTQLKQLWHAATHTQYVVTIGLIPLTLLLFGQISLIGPIANAVAIPVVSFIATPLALIGSILPLPIAGWVLALAHACVSLLASVLTYLSGQAFAVWATPVPPWWMAAIAMLGACWMLAPRGWPLRWFGAFCCLPLVLHQASHPEGQQMTVTALDVGQGMALLIETSDHRLLYDTGPAYSPESDGGSRVILPYLRARGISRLDGVVISHNDNDHSGGALSIFKEMPIAWVSSSLAKDSAIVQAAHHHRPCIAGQRWSWDGVDFEMLQPGEASYASQKWKPNARSCTLKISTKSHSMLLPGDIEAIQEDELIHTIPAKLAADVLLAPHHGSGTSSTPAFLKAVHPGLAIFQVGYLNRYHHPKQDVFDRYGEFGINRLRTDESGAITLQFGAELGFSAYRSEHARYWYHR
ncbi:DNA internalization-related competence protein ComEC/Rec2 [Undibacterium sp. Jales W-56]|uniref:DNA internalization-related competence protein ComEC/Rec2 n=1 Tax=Undibacterium sp. Jales W-56 TaxID=2897325 RepID=UPI0021CF7526|nr:DNA internalization-related competence protein ComEC/Rec2 [Undibacterium sp. Jales W-56]MCU6435435.1 DNA internalization-related competence protein ComEC/Rec2 [Undibacterium sp. Jales W-56]